MDIGKSGLDVVEGTEGKGDECGDGGQRKREKRLIASFGTIHSLPCFSEPTSEGKEGTVAVSGSHGRDISRFFDPDVVANFRHLAVSAWPRFTALSIGRPHFAPSVIFSSTTGSRDNQYDFRLFVGRLSATRKCAVPMARSLARTTQHGMIVTQCSNSKPTVSRLFRNILRCFPYRLESTIRLCASRAKRVSRSHHRSHAHKRPIYLLDSELSLEREFRGTWKEPETGTLQERIGIRGMGPGVGTPLPTDAKLERSGLTRMLRVAFARSAGLGFGPISGGIGFVDRHSRENLNFVNEDCMTENEQGKISSREKSTTCP